MERFGLGPDVCLARNERLVYGRMTGWGQDGPLAPRPGHDINYIALSGALGSIGRRGEPPVPPLNLVGDFGGGGLLLAFGIVSAVLEARSSGRGQVVDAAMTDGSALLLTMLYGARNAGLWTTERGTNLLDGGAPFYDVYATSDGLAVAVGCLEEQFYAELLRVLELDGAELGDYRDPASWPGIRATLRETFARRTRAEWEAAFAGSEACFAPVLDIDEAPSHPHNRARETFYDTGDGAPPRAGAPLRANASCAPGSGGAARRRHGARPGGLGLLAGGDPRPLRHGRGARRRDDRLAAHRLRHAGVEEESDLRHLLGGRRPRVRRRS